MKHLREQLDALSKPSPGLEAEWLGAAEMGVEFLKDHCQSDRCILFASMNAVLIHTVLAPLPNLEDFDRAALRHHFLQADASWKIEHASGGGEADRVYLDPPLGRNGILSDGEKLVFRRSFAGRSSSSPIEISQKLVHALDLHFDPERNSFVRLDEEGDIEDVIKIVQERQEDWSQNVTIVTILAKEFTEYMRLANMGMVIFFDFTRHGKSFSGWNGGEHFDHKSPDLFFDGLRAPGYGSYVAGRMIARPQVTYEEIVQEHVNRRSGGNRQYVTFKAQDWKNKKLVEVSCDPKATSTYFEKDSDKPFEVSPVFFRAEVLHRYKADPEKYDLHDRSISCRGTWELRTYDVNEEGQVHTYLRYLAELPYNEQLYWKTFNEWPKAPISKRAITTDFEGTFHQEYDALSSLRHAILSLDEDAPPWWKPRGEELRKAVHTPVTTSPAEWANEILSLDQLVNEGFLEKKIKAAALGLGVACGDDWKTFRILEECLKWSGLSDVDARTAITQLRTARDLRNHLKGHAAVAKRRELEKKARAEFGSFKAQFEFLAGGMDQTLRLIVRILEPQMAQRFPAVPE